MSDDKVTSQEHPSIMVDVTRIAQYSKLISQIGQGMNKMKAPLFIRDFSIAYDITSNLLFDVTRRNLRAEHDLEIAESIAYLENARAYLEAHGIKDSADARKRYIPLDPAVIKATSIKNETEALASFLKIKLNEFKMSVEAVKKIAYGDIYLSPDEGM